MAFKLSNGFLQKLSSHLTDLTSALLISLLIFAIASPLPDNLSVNITESVIV
jgi:hypothetical protein